MDEALNAISVSGLHWVSCERKVVSSFKNIAFQDFRCS